MSPEQANAVVKALQLLASVGDEMYEALQRKIRWISIEDGAVLFNNEYPIDKDETVEMALLLLGCARRLKKI